MPLSGRQGTDIHPKPQGDRRANLVAVENLALDLARLDDLLGQRLEGGFGLQLEAKAFHPAQKPTLLVADLGEAFRELFGIPLELRPLRPFVNINHDPAPSDASMGLISSYSRYS